MSEAEALLLDRSLRSGPQETALEEGWLLAELDERFGYGQEELARRFDRSVSWVSRRMGLVELLPDSVQQQVRIGAIAAHGRGDRQAPVELPRSGPVVCGLARGQRGGAGAAVRRAAAIPEDTAHLGGRTAVAGDCTGGARAGCDARDSAGSAPPSARCDRGTGPRAVSAVARHDPQGRGRAEPAGGCDSAGRARREGC